MEMCYRPKEEYTDEELLQRSQVVSANRVTNHWFPKKTGNRFATSKRHPLIELYIQNPEKVYEETGLKPQLNSEQMKLIGFDFENTENVTEPNLDQWGLPIEED